MMDPREQRGLIIAALCKLNRDGGEWLVPSQSATDTVYRVNPESKTCTCPDHENGFKCKHLHAVEITLKRELRPDGTVVETQSVTFTEEKTYKQDWTAYNRAQSVEKDRFQELLFDLCSGMPEPERRSKNGRPPHTTRDMVFSMVFKVYATVSSRRFSSDLREAHKRGHLSKAIPGLKLPIFFENPLITPILKKLIARSALPLRAVETEFAIDSSGFSTSKFERWFDTKYGCDRQKAIWVKTHISCGVKTNIVTAVRILDKDAADCPQFGPLVRETAKGFQVCEVSADKAYSSLENFETVADCGGTGFIAFKDNTTGAKGGLFEKMFHYFQYKRDEFLTHYHKRSNVESTFSMIKRKFGDAVRSRTDVAMENEVLCKILAHNICCLIQEQHELGIETEFWGEKMEQKPEPPTVSSAPLVIDIHPVENLPASVDAGYDCDEFSFL